MSYQVSPRPAGLPQGISQEQIEFAKSLRAEMTPAGNKARPGRGRPSPAPVGRGRGSVYSPRPIGTSYNPPPAQSGNGASYGMNGWYAVGPTTAAPVFKPLSPPKRSASPVNTSRSASGPATMGQTPAVRRAASPVRAPSPSKIRNPVLIQEPRTSAHPSSFAVQPVHEVSTTNHLAAAPVPNPGRFPIVTNWTPDDPSKPVIAPHFRQDSASKAIQDIAQVAGVSYEELTQDGYTIGKRRAVSCGGQGLSDSTYNPSGIQQVAVKQEWLNIGATNNAQQSTTQQEWCPPSTNSNGNGSREQGVPGSSQDPWSMDIDMVDGVPVVDRTVLNTGAFAVDIEPTLAALPTFSESQWATPAYRVSKPAPMGNVVNENIRPASQDFKTATHPKYVDNLGNFVPATETAATHPAQASLATDQAPGFDSASAQNPYSLNVLDPAGIHRAVELEQAQKRHQWSNFTTNPTPVDDGGWFTETPGVSPVQHTQAQASPFANAGVRPAQTNPFHHAGSSSAPANACQSAPARQPITKFSNIIDIPGFKEEGLKESKWA